MFSQASTFSCETPLILGCDLLVAAALSWLANGLALFSCRRTDGLHWTERARVLWPARVAAGSGLWVIPVDVVLGQLFFCPDHGPHWLLTALAAFVGVVVGNYPLNKRVFPWLTPRLWVWEVLSACILRLAPMLFLLPFLPIVPSTLDWRAWSLVGLYVAVLVGWTWGGMVGAGRIIGLFTPASERLQALVSAVATRMNVRVRSIWLIHSPFASAFALPYTSGLLFSERLLMLHPDEEVTAICAHEIGHLRESKTILAARALSGLALVPWLLLNPLVRGWGPPAFLVLAALSVAVLSLSRRLSLRLEQRADRIAHDHESDPGALARALARLHEENLIPAVLPKKRYSHPDLYDRLTALGVQPEYPRPALPSPMAWHGRLFGGLAGALAVLNCLRWLE